MARSRRPHQLLVKLSDAEREALRARAQERRVPMADVLRGSLTEPPPVPAEPSWEWTLGLLARAAEHGDVRAMIALARELHPAPARAAAPEQADARGEFGLRAVK